MRLLHYLEIENFKRFGDRQRIELDHPAVLIGPNNCGKTTAIQAIALWSQAVKTWYDNKGKAPPKERKATSINRLKVVSVPVQRTRYFWHNASVRKGNHAIWLEITLGILHNKKVEPVTMRFRNQGEDLVYCTPDDRGLYAKVTVFGLLGFFDGRDDALRQKLRRSLDLQHPRFRATTLRLRFVGLLAHLDDLRRLQSRHNNWQFSSFVLPPSIHGLT